MSGLSGVGQAVVAGFSRVPAFTIPCYSWPASPLNRTGVGSRPLDPIDSSFLNKTMEIQGKVFLVTGGASGLGAGTSRMLVANGGKVAVADLNDTAGTAFAKELGPAATFVRTDVADEGSGRGAVDAALNAFGAIHGLVNCAGIAIGERVLG